MSKSMSIEQALGLGGTSGLIGGSVVGAILNVNPYSNPHKAWQVMTGRLVVSETAPMRRGTILEGVIAELSERPSMMPPEWREWRTAAAGERVTLRDPVIRTARWAPDDCLTMSIDRTVHVRDLAGSELMIGIQEIKSSNLYAPYDGGTIKVDDFSITVPVPPSYWLQVQQYMAGFEVDRAWLTALRATEAMFNALIDLAMRGAVPAGGELDPFTTYQQISLADGVINLKHDSIVQAADAAELLVTAKAATLLNHQIERHPAYIETVAPYLRAWHERHIVADVPPPIDHSDTCTEVLQAEAGERSGEIEVTAEIAGIASNIDQIVHDEKQHKAALKQLAKDKAKQLNLMRKATGSAKKVRGEFGDMFVNVDFGVTAVVPRVKASELEAADPELYQRIKYDTGGSEKMTVKCKAVK